MALGRTRRTARSLRAARPTLFTAAAVGVGFAVLTATAGFGDGHASRAGSQPVVQRIGDVEFVVDGAVRLADGHAGVNSAKLPMGGPAMPMVGAGAVEGATSGGEERISVAVRFWNRGAVPVSYDALDVELLSSGRPAALLRPVESTLGAGLLPAGARVAGDVYFVIEDGTDDLTVHHVSSRREIPVVDDADAGAGGGPAKGHGGH